MERTLDGLTFPLNLEKFVAYHQKACGNELQAIHRELLAAWLPVINAAYQDGVEGRTLNEEYPAHSAAAEAYTRIMQRWVHFAWLMGGTPKEVSGRA